MGEDPISGKNFDHRKVWIEEYLRELAGRWAWILLGFRYLSLIHFSLDSEIRVLSLGKRGIDQEVARRW